MSYCRGDHVLVLAAGRGTRMGTPKALMNIDDEPWWVRQYGQLAMIGVLQTWVVSDAVHLRMQQREDVPNLVVTSPTKPMFDSLLTGLTHLSHDPPRGVFILPVDVPVPQLAVFRTLAGKERPALPEFQGRTGHPIYLPWAWLCERVLPPESGGRAMPLFGDQRRLDRITAKDRELVSVFDPTVLVNLNTPQDVENWQCPGLAE